MSAAYRLAHNIMWVQATEIVRRTHPSLYGRGSKQRRREMIAMEFDQHAAVELANLIERRMAEQEPTT